MDNKVAEGAGWRLIHVDGSDEHDMDVHKKPGLCIEGDIHGLSADEARSLGRALVAGADRLEQQ